MSRCTRVLAVAAILGGCSDATEIEMAGPDMAAVLRGSLRITIDQRATIKAAEETKVLNQMEGKNTTVIWLIEERLGTR